MRIDLKWLDPNKGRGHSTQIYRSTNPFDSLDDATLIATVGPGITTYEDADVIYRGVYYYRLNFVYLNQRPATSKLYEFRAMSYTGPGTTTLTFGDENFGYYGTIDPSLATSPTINDIRQVFGLNPLTTMPADERLYKFTIGGSVRATYQYPIANGADIPRDNLIFQKLISGEPHYLEYGLHQWAMIIPSADHVDNSQSEYRRYPGELRSMLGVITDLYTRIEDVQFGNRTGDCLGAKGGSVEFYDYLTERFPTQDIKYIASSDWTSEDVCNVISWTPKTTTYPVRPRELHVESVDFTDPSEWNKVLFWPVLVYVGLVGPR